MPKEGIIAKVGLYRKNVGNQEAKKPPIIMPALSLDFSKFKALQIPKDKAAIGTYALPGAMRFKIIPAMASPQRIPL